MNIYITQPNEEWLRAQKTSMSGIVNGLLEKERGASPVQVAGEALAEALTEQTGRVTRYIHDPAKKTDDGPIVADYLNGLGMEAGCCAGNTPCKHWTFNGDTSEWVNSLSGRKKQA